MIVRLTVLLTLLSPVLASGWELSNGENIGGFPAAFDFQKKSVSFHNRLSESNREIPVEDLELGSRQRLLFSSAFHGSYPSDEKWPEEKRNLMLFAMLAPMISLFVGFWLAGWFITGKYNPIRAVFGFLGSWIVGGLLILCYLMFAEMAESKGMIIGAGVIMSTIIVGVFVSAVYSCTFLKGVAVFLLQTLVAISVTALGLVAFNFAVPEETQERFWRENVFVPVGLQAKSDSSQVR